MEIQTLPYPKYVSRFYCYTTLGLHNLNIISILFIILFCDSYLLGSMEGGQSVEGQGQIGGSVPLYWCTLVYK